MTDKEKALVQTASWIKRGCLADADAPPLDLLEELELYGLIDQYLLGSEGLTYRISASGRYVLERAKAIAERESSK